MQGHARVVLSLETRVKGIHPQFQ
ncbi:unnamed protein product, partial [Vitis vinifera]